MFSADFVFFSFMFFFSSSLLPPFALAFPAPAPVIYDDNLGCMFPC